jgi:formate dehydrogenase subunit delta
MKAQYLVDMANDIGAFFVSEAGESEAPKSIANHITRFWDPRMRREMIAYYQAKGGAGLSDVALKAVAQLTLEAAQKSSTSQ